MAVPKDGSLLRMILKDATGAIVEERSVRIDPGATMDITWTPTPAAKKP